MHRSTRVAAIAVLLALGSAAPAYAAACPPGQHQRSSLTLTVSPSGDSSERTTQRSTTLECGTPAGSHPRKVEACSQLEAAGGNLDSLNAEPEALCTMVYAPVTATATGTWRGTPVEWQKTYANECQLTSETGHVFNTSTPVDTPHADPTR
ncbi:subtilase-type protease inhibitor [Streptomyces erythrochromogenes]|uniref:subtilase-type protease inhibitor n=1 Tax=Streptomyces erythrochromogenes TaxID=285574 RepID=UPI0037F421E1